MLVQQTLGFHGFFDFGSGGNPVAIGDKVRVTIKINFKHMRPIKDGKAIAVGNGEVISHQKFVLGKMLVKVSKLRCKIFSDNFFILFGSGGSPQRTKTLMDLRRDKI